MRKTKQQEDFESTLEFHRHEWRIQRVGWAFIAAFLLLALAGVFGGGPLSHARSGNQNGSIEYERFVRKGALATLTVAPAAERGVKLIEISAGYLHAVRVEQVMPEPSSVRSSGEHFVYEFASSSSAVPIVFHLHPEQLGRHTAQVVIDAGRPLTLSQLIYP